MDRRNDAGKTPTVDHLTHGSASDSCDDTQNFITLMDALKLKLRAKDQLHPILSELMSSYAKLNKSSEWEGRPKILQWCVFDASSDPSAHTHPDPDPACSSRSIR